MNIDFNIPHQDKQKERISTYWVYFKKNTEYPHQECLQITMLCQQVVIPNHNLVFPPPNTKFLHLRKIREQERELFVNSSICGTQWETDFDTQSFDTDSWSTYSIQTHDQLSRYRLHTLSYRLVLCSIRKTVSRMRWTWVLIKIIRYRLMMNTCV